MQPDDSARDTTRGAATTTATPHAARQLRLRPQRHATLRRCNYSLINYLFFLLHVASIGNTSRVPLYFHMPAMA
jgi:hypothetical protein